MHPDMEAMKIKPGEVRNPKGNADGHSTRPISRRIEEVLENGIETITTKTRFKSRKAHDALIAAMFERAIGVGDDATGSLADTKNIIELVEGKTPDRLDLTSNGKTIAQQSQLAEFKEALREEIDKSDAGKSQELP